MTKGRAQALPFLVGGWFWMWTLKVKANEDIAIISRRRVMCF